VILNEENIYCDRSRGGPYAGQASGWAAPPFTTPLEPRSESGLPLQISGETLEDLVSLVRAEGYRCDSITAAIDMAYTVFTSKEKLLFCNHSTYSYSIVDKGGRLIVIVK